MELDLVTRGLGSRISTVDISRIGCFILVIVPPNVRAIISHPKQIPNTGTSSSAHLFRSNELIQLLSLLLIFDFDQIETSYDVLGKGGKVVNYKYSGR